MLPAIPSARVVRAASSPRSRHTAAVAPKMPTTAVGCSPRSWKALGAAMPIRATISLPATIAVSSSRPLAPHASAAATAAGQTTTLMWQVQPACVSSKSSVWHATAFANAAFAAGMPSRWPITDACGSPPSSAIVTRPSMPRPYPSAASPRAHHVEQVQLRVLDDVLRDVVEGQGGRELRESLRSGHVVSSLLNAGMTCSPKARIERVFAACPMPSMRSSTSS